MSSYLKKTTLMAKGVGKRPADPDNKRKAGELERGCDEDEDKSGIDYAMEIFRDAHPYLSDDLNKIWNHFNEGLEPALDITVATTCQVLREAWEQEVSLCDGNSGPAPIDLRAMQQELHNTPHINIIMDTRAYAIWKLRKAYGIEDSKQVHHEVCYQPLARSREVREKHSQLRRLGCVPVSDEERLRRYPEFQEHVRAMQAIIDREWWWEGMKRPGD